MLGLYPVACALSGVGAAVLPWMKYLSPDIPAPGQRESVLQEQRDISCAAGGKSIKFGALVPGDSYQRMGASANYRAGWENLFPLQTCATSPAYFITTRLTR